MSLFERRLSRRSFNTLLGAGALRLVFGPEATPPQSAKEGIYTTIPSNQILLDIFPFNPEAYIVPVISPNYNRFLGTVFAGKTVDLTKQAPKLLVLKDANERAQQFNALSSFDPEVAFAVGLVADLYDHGNIMARGIKTVLRKSGYDVESVPIIPLQNFADYYHEEKNDHYGYSYRFGIATSDSTLGQLADVINSRGEEYVSMSAQLGPIGLESGLYPVDGKESDVFYEVGAYDPQYAKDNLSRVFDLVRACPKKKFTFAGGNNGDVFLDPLASLDRPEGLFL